MLNDFLSGKVLCFKPGELEKGRYGAGQKRLETKKARGKSRREAKEKAKENRR